jgi:DNA repair protein RecO (recombination protein O)
MLHNTKALVVHSVHYGDSSLILHLYTELFGIISCIVKGARKQGKGGGKSILLQVGNVVDVSLQYNTQKRLQHLKEINAYYLPPSERTHVLKHGVVAFVCELLYKTVTEPEHMPEIFELSMATIKTIHEHEYATLKLVPHFYALQLALQLGFGIQNNYDRQAPYLDLLHSEFTNVYTNEANCCSMQESELIANLLNADYAALGNIETSIALRRDVLYRILLYLKIHLPQMQQLNSIGVIQSLMS